jgi:uncharacterized membrane protein
MSGDTRELKYRPQVDALEDRLLLTMMFTLKDLGTLGGSESYGTAIYDATKMTGSSNPGPGSNQAQLHAFKASYDGTTVTMSDLGLLSGGTYSRGRGINSVGHVTGLARSVLGTSIPSTTTEAQ